MRAPAKDSPSRRGSVNMFARLANLRDQGFVPSRILDVGANRGLWTKAVRQIWPRAQLLMFEANPNLVPELEGSGAPFRIAVLGETARDVTMHFGRGKSITGSSMFRESGKHRDNFDATTVRMQTLDDALASERARDGGYQLLKIDVQGAELKVLEGATRTLRSVEAIVLELSIVQYNEGAPLWLEMQSRLGALGYQVYDVLELHYHAGERHTPQCIQVDLLFVRTSSRLWHANVTGFPKPAWPPL